jgi:AraC-like DNA-binding protein
MRIVRPDSRWWILLPERRGGPVCLHGLALRCGYRICEVCAELDCGERYLHLVFVRDVGMPPKRWMREERMVVARRELDRGRSVVEVAAALGFGCVRTFRREFMALLHVPPSAYQRERCGLVRGEASGTDRRAG